MLQALKYHGWKHENSKFNLVNEKGQGGYNLKFSPSFGTNRNTRNENCEKKAITVTMTMAGNDNDTVIKNTYTKWF